ncbi:putative nonmuscle myosin heavy chain b [Calocera viscosa TUFC12733]|uniref:Putative nonmuscle myosin heavy chain b n=1 Tax=Calocera viscosa (strain TUFC12733) TaxID=1330018 RepID=A0A167K7Q4_CALVF|nr:putative nonmuscle myosin heavy chain b [Calocera viscosa TUFC12733]
MPVPVRASHEEAARAAEFNEKKWVWVPDEKEGYLAGWVVKEEQDEEMGEVMLAAGGEHRTLPLYMLSKMNPPKFDRVDDIADLTYLNEASVVHNLRLRYGSNAIYTYSGLFLVAINPYQTLPLYTDAIIDQYRHRRRDEVPPHIFAIAERAWVHMNEERECQSVLITGESGAGKTENTKKVIQYLASIASEAYAAPSTPTHSRTSSAVVPHSPIPRSHSSNSSIASMGLRGLGLLERQILQANPILEAFGNAQTLKNNNSSRFGKFVRISFSSDSSISGAEIDWYLLEKSRVTFRHEGERSFHVFYQLLEGGGAFRDALLLEGGAGDYEYLNKSRSFVDGVDDKEEWRQLKTALDIVGFTNSEQLDLFRIISAILHIGNLTMISTRSVEQTAFTSESQPVLEKICHLLGLPSQEFPKAVLRPRTKAGREWVTQQRTADQVKDELASLSKILYERCFGSLVERINKALDRPSSKSTFIGVLDIAGFEIFETNSFEQLCINYTNEKLQQFFNHHMFVLEQEEYSRESIEWDFVNFGLDLQPTIDLIESRDPIGILSCLDEECIMPKASDITFTSKVHALWAEVGHPGSAKYAPTRFEQGFVIQHYAGKVEYRTDGWLQKNKDPLNDNLTRLLATSSEKYIAGLFAEYAEDATATPVSKKRVKKGAFRTVGQRHKEQLSQLMNQLQATQPHFVRCIVPNSLKKPGKLDIPLVLDQLRCNGVLEGIRIARLGYPNRLPFAEFRQRYEVLTPGVIPRGYMDGRKASTKMIDSLDLDPAIYKIGTSKVFFKAGVLADLEEKRDAHLFDVFSRFQAVARMFSARRQMRKVLNRANAIRTIQRNARVYVELREWPWWQLYTKVRPMLAATRNDEELRKKDTELATVREKAEKDKREKVGLEAEIIQLRSEKKKVEDELESERRLGLDKDQQLARSKARECDLEDDVAALQIDFDAIEAELARVAEARRTSDLALDTLSLAHEDAKIRLAALEEQQRDWKKTESRLLDDVRKRSSECTSLKTHRDQLQKTVDEHETALLAREEEVARLKERIKARELKVDDEAASLNAELARLADAKKTADHNLDALSLVHEDVKIRLAGLEEQQREWRKKESRLKHRDELEKTVRQHQASIKQVAELQVQLKASHKEIEAQKGDLQKDVLLRSKLQVELDELRKFQTTKTAEDRKRSEAERGKEHERAELRSQVTQLQAQLADVRRQAREGQSKLEVDLNLARRELAATTKTLVEDLQQQAKAHAQSLREAELAAIQAEKQKRTAEAELQSVRNKHVDADSQLAQLTEQKESLERRLASAQAKHQDFEDAVLQIEREKASWARHMEAARKQLSAETSRRQKLEQAISTRDTEITKLNDLQGSWENELAKLKSDLAAREHEIGQLRGRPADITIIEHVHVLEEAKRVTDRQLLEAQAELESLQLYVRSLERAKQRPQSVSEQQMQILSQQSQIRELRAVLEEAESDRVALQRARRNLESRLDEIEQAQFRLPERTVQGRAAVV